MELLAAALGHHADDAAGIAAVFGLVVAGQHAHFGDGIHVRLEVRGTVGAGVQVGDAIHREVRAASMAPLIRTDPMVFSLVVSCCVSVHPGQRDHQAEQIAALQGDVRHLVLVDQLGVLARGGL